MIKSIFPKKCDLKRRVCAPWYCVVYVPKIMEQKIACFHWKHGGGVPTFVDLLISSSIGRMDGEHPWPGHGNSDSVRLKVSCKNSHITAFHKRSNRFVSHQKYYGNPFRFPPTIVYLIPHEGETRWKRHQMTLRLNDGLSHSLSKTKKMLYVVDKQKQKTYCLHSLFGWHQGGAKPCRNPPWNREIG